MRYDNRQALPKDYSFIIKEDKSNNEYRITVSNEIGRGGSCVVYQGTIINYIDPNGIFVPVIVKEFYPRDLDTKGLTRKNGVTFEVIPELQREFDDELEDFREEQKKHILFASNHPEESISFSSISGKSNGTFYAVSNIPEGQVLSDVDRNELSLLDALYIGSSICKAISYVHHEDFEEKDNGEPGADNWLYLDLKPSNIFVDGNRAKLFDFNTSQRWLRYDYCSYSKGWSAPEQKISEDGNGYEDDLKIGFQSDVYAIGMIVFWLLTGKTLCEMEIDEIPVSFDWKKQINIKNATDALQYEKFIKALDRTMRQMLCYDSDERKKWFADSGAADVAKEKIEHLVDLAIEAPDNKREERIHAHLNSVQDSHRLDIENLQRNFADLIARHEITSETEQSGNTVIHDQYDGESKDGIPNGKGVLIRADGSRYEGEFRDGKPYGMISYSSDYYDNTGIEKLVAEFEGFGFPSNGVLLYTNGDKYTGELCEGIPHGHGFMCYNSNDKYRGKFKHGTLDGYGVMNYENGDIFIGRFKNNSYSQGVCYYQESNSFFEGSFCNGLKEGKGIVTFADGSKYEGTFVNGNFEGVVKVTDKNGNIQSHYCIDGEPINSQIIETTDLDDPFFQMMKVENDLSQIKKSGYSFTTKKRIYRISKIIKALSQSYEGKEIIEKKSEQLINEMLLCNKYYSKEAVRSGDTSLFAAIELIQSIIEIIKSCHISTSGWGPKRHVYDNSEYVPYPTFNSKKDNKVLGDERAFVFIRKHGEERYDQTPPEIIPGERYDVRIYFNNNVDSSLPSEYGCATGVKISTYFPTVLKKNEKGEIGGVVHSTNSSPKEVWNQRYIRTSYEKIYLHYVAGSAIIHNNHSLDGCHISDD